MRRFYIWLWLLILVCGSCTKEKQELSVLHLNIWMEGTVVKNGFEAVADEVARIDPDIVMFSEASNKEGALFVPRMLDALRERGKIYYGQGSSLDVALLSKYPILEQTENIPHKDRVLRCERQTGSSLYRAFGLYALRLLPATWIQRCDMEETGSPGNGQG